MKTTQVYSFFEHPDGSRVPNIVTAEYSLQVIGTKDGLLCGYSEKPSKDNPHGKNNVGPDKRGGSNTSYDTTWRRFPCSGESSFIRSNKSCPS